MKYKLGYIALILAAISFTLVPLSFTGCKQLDTAGPYGSGQVAAGTNTITATNAAAYIADSKILYEADAAITGGYDTLQAFVAWESNNSIYLWSVSHDIKHTADTIRLNAEPWLRRVVLARDAFAASATDANHTTLQNALAVVTTALANAQTIQTANPNIK